MNRYDLAFLQGQIGLEETVRLEFKSSQDLCSDRNKRKQFIEKNVCKAVSAMLNTDGGEIIIGIEEVKGRAERLSEGVSRSIIGSHELQQTICGLVQPAVGGHVSVYNVLITPPDAPEKLFAFVVDVKAGTTAYQAPDHRYYVRRVGQSVPMDDKDVRLRMLGRVDEFTIGDRSGVPAQNQA